MSTDIGKEYIYKRTVQKEDMASFIGSGGQDVFATPSMITWMEIASVLCLDLQDEELCSLGVAVDIEHVAATPLGSEITVVSKLKSIEGRLYTFEVEAFDKFEKIGFGTHKRAVVNKDKFMSKVTAKLNA